MKKSGLILLAIIITFTCRCQDIVGQWNGILKIQGIELRIVFNISKIENGYSSTMDSPDQGAKDIPIAKTTFADSALKLEMPAMKIEYSGRLNNKNNFIGKFTQGGQSLPLDLSRAKSEIKMASRPQEPVKPYPYLSEDVEFKNEKGDITLAGTLTLPKSDGIFPAVILITGSGPQNRDEELLGHKPFLVLSDYLTRNGIAVLRFDDRGVGQSKGKFKEATTLDFASDVASAITYLETRKEINKKKIGLIGHSEGGVIAPMVAAKDKRVAFIVMLAGTGIRGDKLLLLQQELIAKASGVSHDTIMIGKKINQGAFDIVLNDKPESLKSDLTNYLRRVAKEYPSASSDSGGQSEANVDRQLDVLTSPWMVFFIKYDPSVALKKVTCPVLALNGEKDLQVPAEIDLKAIRKSLEEGGNKHVTTKTLPNLNHLFQECKTGLPAEYAKIEQTFSPSALSEISNWIILTTR